MKSLLLSLFIIPQLVYSQNWTQLGADIDGEAAGDHSGISVSMNSAGDRLAIGADLASGNGLYSGVARIYSYNGSVWTQLGADIDGEAAGDHSGISVSMNSAGNRVAIGAHLNTGNGADAGHVRIYSYNGSVWTQLGADIDGTSGDQSGRSVSMNSVGDRVVIGADYASGNGLYSGAARIYSYNGSVWTQLGGDIDGEAAGDQSGRSVSMNSAGDRVVIGAFWNGGNYGGHARIYSYNGSSWTQLGADIDGEAAGDQSGCSVSMNSAGDRVVIGAFGNDENGVDAGHARIYSYNGSVWTQLGGDIDGEAENDLSGRSVSLNSAGDRVAIGAEGNDGNGFISGHARIYSYNGSVWIQLGGDIDGEAVGDQSGRSVSMNSAGDRVAIGAHLNDGNGVDAGHVRVYHVDFTGINELTNTQKELIKIIDFMGRETEFKPNTSLIFIYSDGTRERVMEIEE